MNLKRQISFMALLTLLLTLHSNTALGRELELNDDHREHQSDRLNSHYWEHENYHHAQVDDSRHFSTPSSASAAIEAEQRNDSSISYPTWNASATTL